MAFTSNKSRPGNTRQRIFDSALTLMKAKGYQGTTIRDICQKAGVAPSSFYSHFSSKSDLLQDIYARSDGYFSSELLLLLEGNPFFQQLEIYVRAYAQLNIDTGLEMMRVLFNPENEWFSRERPMQKTLLKVIHMGIESGDLSQDTDPEQLVRDLFIVLRGTCYDWCVREGSYDLEKTMLKQVHYFLWGALKS